MSSFFLPASGSAVTIVAAVVGCSLANTGAARGVMGFETDIRDDGVVNHVQPKPRQEVSVVAHLIVYNEDMGKRALEDQHRQVMTRIGAGEIVLPPSPSVPSQS